MPAEAKLRYLSVEDYLEGETRSDIRHEYVAGQVFAMLGTTLAHNLVTLNLASALHSHLRGTPCHVVATDMKVRVRAADAFYYPDLAVFCNAESRKALYLEQPRLIVEVLSPSTAQVDQREKKLAYQKLESLQEYALVAQDQVLVELYRRAVDGWDVAIYGPDEMLDLRSVGLALPSERFTLGWTWPDSRELDRRMRPASTRAGRVRACGARRHGIRQLVRSGADMQLRALILQ